MPELPEVQTTVNGLNSTVKNKKITDVWSDYFLNTKNRRKDTIKDKKFFEFFKKEILGKTIKKAERRGKNVLIHLTDNKTILIHMKMTGHLLYGNYIIQKGKWIAIEPKELTDPFNRFIHLIFTLSNKKHLAFSDMRKFAKVTLINTSEINDCDDLKIGPEPIPDLNSSVFKKQLLKKKNGKIKTVLMDQKIVAGIGNIYSDEILWLSHVHPTRIVSSLSKKEIKDILSATKKILASSINTGGDSMSDYRNIHGIKGGFQNFHKAYKRTREKCSKKDCRGIITRKIIGGRSSHFCSVHQK